MLSLHCLWNSCMTAAITAVMKAWIAFFLSLSVSLSLFSALLVKLYHLFMLVEMFVFPLSFFSEELSSWLHSLFPSLHTFPLFFSHFILWKLFFSFSRFLLDKIPLCVCVGGIYSFSSACGLYSFSSVCMCVWAILLFVCMCRLYSFSSVYV